MVLLAFAGIGLTGGWHGITAIAAVLALGHALLAAYAATSPAGPARIPAAIAFAFAAAVAATLLVSFGIYHGLQGNLALPLLAAAGFALLAAIRRGAVRLWLVICAVLIGAQAVWYALLSMGVWPDTDAYAWGVRTLDALFAGGLVVLAFLEHSVETQAPTP